MDYGEQVKLRIAVTRYATSGRLDRIFRTNLLLISLLMCVWVKVKVL